MPLDATWRTILPSDRTVENYVFHINFSLFLYTHIKNLLIH